MDIGTLTGHIELEDLLTEKLTHISDGVKKFAGEFAERFGGTGVVMGGVAVAAVAVGAELFKLGQEATETVAKIEDVSAATRIAVPALVDLKFALEATGGSLEQLNTVMFMFEQRMENSSEKVTKGLKAIGLSLEEVQSMSKDQQLLAISDGFRHVGEDVNISAAAMDLFGRQGRTLLPQLIKPLSELAEESKKLGGITAAAAEQADEFEIKHRAMSLSVERSWTELGLVVAPVTNQISLGYERMKLAVANVALSISDGIKGIGSLIDQGLALVGTANDADAALRRLGGDLPKVADSLKGTADGAGLAAKGLDDWHKSVAALALQLPKAAEAEAEFTKQFGSAEEQSKKLREELKRHADAVETVVESLTGESKQAGIEKEAIEQVIASHTKNIDTIARVVSAIDKLKAKHIEVSKSTLDWANANRTIDGVIPALEGHFTQLSIAVDGNSQHVWEMRGVFEKARESIDDLDSYVDEFHDGITIAGDTISTVAIPAFGTLEKGLKGQPKLWEDAENSMESFSDSLAKGFTSTINDIPKILERAFTGGGGFSGAITAIGAKAGADLGAVISKNMKIGVSKGADGKESQSMLGGLLTAGISGGIAGLVNLGVSKLVGALSHIGGPSALEMSGRDLEAQFEKTFGGFDKMVQKVGEVYESTGLGAARARSDIEALLAAEKQGPAAVQSWIDKINEQVSIQTKVKSSVDEITGAANTFGHVLPDSIRESIKALLDMKGLTDDEKTSLQGLLDGGQTNFQALQSRASEFGITLEQLGPKFEQADIESRAQDIHDIFTDLVAAGGDTDGVLTGLSDELNQLVDDSLKFGVAIPDNMKPLIDQLIKAGKLTDENGELITDMSKLTFEKTPLATSLQTLSASIDHLAQVLSGVPGQLGAVATAANGIPDNPFANWAPPEVDTSRAMAAQGGRVTHSGVSYYASGNVLGSSFARGSDTVPAMLTPGEEVSSVSDVQARDANLSALRRMQQDTNDRLESIERLLGDQPRAMADAMTAAAVLLPSRRAS